MKKRLGILILNLILSIFLTGCGETVHGVVKDTGRITKGVQTIIFREKGSK